MKVYVIYGHEGTPKYEKQSIKLPKSWATKPTSEVLKLFLEGYNKKHPDTPLAEGGVHLEKPLGSTVFPDEHIANIFTDYCDIFCVEGTVVHKTGDGTKTDAKSKAKMLAEKMGETEDTDKDKVPEPVKEVEEKEWDMRVRVTKMDKGAMNAKAGADFKVGTAVTVKIEPHGTIGMMKDRIALIVGAHPKHQAIRPAGCPNDPPLDILLTIRDAMKGQHPMLQRDLELEIFVPTAVEEELTALSDDEGCTGTEEEPVPEPLDEAARSKELSEAEVDQVGAFKQAAAECADAGDVTGAIAKYSEAIAVGAPGALLLCKRGELLLKVGRPAAACADGEAALALNPDSCKAFKLRGKARRKLGDYDGALEDLGQAQKIDFDDGVAEVLGWVQKRVSKIRKLRLREEHAVEAAAKAVADAEKEAKAAADKEAKKNKGKK